MPSRSHVSLNAVKNLQRIAQYQNKKVGELLAAPGVKNMTYEAER